MTPGRLQHPPGVFFVAWPRGERICEHYSPPICRRFATLGREKGIAVRLILVIIFGAAGTLARYGLQGFVQEFTGSEFPSGTLVVNLIGCFLLGGIAEYALTHLTIPPEWRIAITVGFFGAFTTFSSFSWETTRMMQDGEWGRASVYVIASVVGGLFLAFIGMRIGERI